MDRSRKPQEGQPQGPAAGRAPRVRLIDGREVSSYSEEWRHECEARSVCLMPSRQVRNNHIELIASKRGPKEAERLREKCKQMWPHVHGI